MDTKWYVIRTVAGKEKKALEQLKFEIDNLGFSNKVNQIVIPTERISHLRKGKKISVERNPYPGYILIETDPIIIGELSGLNKIINFVTGFLGGKNPTPLKPDEVSRILGQIDKMSSEEEITVEKFNISESVKIVDGPFNGFTGSIQEVVNEKHRLKIDVKIFGRNTPIELDYSQVEKIY